MKTTNQIDAKLGKLLRLARNANGMSQDQLGSLNDLTFQQIQKYERGQNRISVSRLMRIAENLSVPATWFIEKLSNEKAETDIIDIELLSKRESQDLLSSYIKIKDKSQRQFLRLITTLLAGQKKDG